MADALDMYTVAEGMKAMEPLRELRALSCDETQGHHVLHSVAANEVASLLLKRFLFVPSGQQESMTTV